MPASNIEIVNTYRALTPFIEGFRDGHFDLLILTGSPGTAKTSMVRETLGEMVCWLTGSVSAFYLYLALFFHRDQLVVMDDVDQLATDRDAVRLMKCLCQTEREKWVHWGTAARALDQLGVPRRFPTTSRLLIVTNDWRNASPDVAALEDRGIVLEFAPTALEVHVRTAGWFWDQEIFDFIGQFLHLIASPSMRFYRVAWQLKKAGIDWQDSLLRRALQITDAKIVAAKLLADSSFPNNAARATAFAEEMKRLGKKGRRSTFYKLAEVLVPAEAPPKIILNNPVPQDWEDGSAQPQRWDVEPVRRPPPRLLTNKVMALSA